MSYARRQNESNAYLTDVLQRCLRPYQEPRAAYLLPWNCYAENTPMPAAA